MPVNRDFGDLFAESLTVSDLASEGLVFQIGIPPNRIDVLTAIDRVGFAEAWAERVRAPYGDVEAQIISRRHLVRTERATGRPQDALDAESLERG